MMKKITAFIMAFVMCFFTAVITFQITKTSNAGKTPDGTPDNDNAVSIDEYIDGTYVTKELLDKLKGVAELYSEYYVDDEKIDPDYFLEYIMAGFSAGAEDDFGHYLNKENYDATMQDIDGEYYGIGISVIYNKNYNCIEVISVFPESPAIEAGLVPGDLITHVEGESVAEVGYYESIDRVKGLEGETVTLKVLRGANYEESLEFKVPRRKVTEITVTWKMYEKTNNVAIVNIYSFNSKTPEQFVSAVNSAVAAGAQGIVFDVRGNPGGELNSICTILDMLLPSGPIVRFDYKGEENDGMVESGPEYFDFPMVVLCNEYTASAAELFTSALQDYDAAKVVGVTTYGKGTMQSILPLGDGTGYAVTTAYYLPPKSPNYHGVGVVPDEIVEMPEEYKNIYIGKLTPEQDIQLQAAVAITKQIISQQSSGGTVTY
ncbi:MAG: S41 family peptidase [Clostridia bacterium]|nr:S41 family peptidase [Clostridia bacterium]